MKSNVNRFDDVFYTAISMLLVPVLLVLIGSLTLGIREALAPWMFPATIGLSIVICFIFTKKWLYPLLLLIFYAFSLIISSWVIDWSYDGIGYHQEIVDGIMNGWNPYSSMSFAKNSDHSLWYYTYAKAIELARAMIGLSFGFIEVGKMVNFCLWISSSMLAWCALTKILPQNPRRVLWLTIIAVCNPVCITQILTFYVDFTSYCYWLSSLALIVMISIRSHSRLCFSMLFFVSILAVGTKLNILFFQCYLLACWGIWLLISKKMDLFIWVTALGLMAVVVGGIVVYYHPYVTNYIEFGNPFYPIFGNNPEDVMTHVTPELMLSIDNRFANMIISVFTPTIPTFDTRLGGFGPCMGLLLLCSIILCVKFKKNIPVVAIFTILCILASVFIMKQSWWARFTPQLWLIPLIVIICVPTGRIRRVMSGLFVVTLLSLLPVLAYAFSYSYHLHWLYSKLQGSEIYIENVYPQFIRKMQQYDIRLADHPIGQYTVMMSVPGNVEQFRPVVIEDDIARKISAEFDTMPFLEKHLLHPSKFRNKY